MGMYSFKERFKRPLDNRWITRTFSPLSDDGGGPQPIGYILQEDTSRIILEDDTGVLLKEFYG